MCVCKPLDTRGIWERKRADFAALSVFLTTRSKNHSLQPTFVQFLLFKQGGHPQPWLVTQRRGSRFVLISGLINQTYLLQKWHEAKPRTSTHSDLQDVYDVHTFHEVHEFYIPMKSFTFRWRQGMRCLTKEFNLRPTRCRMITPTIPTRKRQMSSVCVCVCSISFKSINYSLYPSIVSSISLGQFLGGPLQAEGRRGIKWWRNCSKRRPPNPSWNLHAWRYSSCVYTNMICQIISIHKYRDAYLYSLRMAACMTVFARYVRVQWMTFWSAPVLAEAVWHDCRKSEHLRPIPHQNCISSTSLCLITVRSKSASIVSLGHIGGHAILK